MHGARARCGGDERGRRTRACAEQSDAEPGGGLVFHQPVGQRRHAHREQGDVEPKLTGPDIDPLLRRREQVDQDRRQAGPLQLAGDVAIPGALAATAASVCEQHEPQRLFRHHDVSFQRDPRHGDLQALLDSARRRRAATELV